MQVPLEKWIRKYFPESSAAEVVKLLSAYGAENDGYRVKRDIVIMSKGSIDKLRQGIKTALIDYRDILVGEEVDPWMMAELRNPPM
jgi:hypothetical protein